MKKTSTCPPIEISFLLIAYIASGCAGRDGGLGSDGGRHGAGDAGTSTQTCVECIAASDCSSGMECARLGGATYCAPICGVGRRCPSDRACSAEPSVGGVPVDVCVPRGDPCGTPPSTRLDGGSTGSIDTGGPIMGQVSAAGGRVSRLYFAVVGDTRPASIDDTTGYPLAIVGKIFQDLQSLDPVPLFGVSTGDYMFASTLGGQATRQLDLYLYARGAFSGIMFPVMGNHECTGATASNCGPGNADGTPDNYLQFLAKMLRPLGQSKPYYAIDIDSSAATWTAKFVFIAANAWDDAQASWLEATLARATTYTFIVRHEPRSASTAPGVIETERIQARHPYTLLIAGHSHTYARSGVNEVIIGNGGAPLTSSKANYGFGLIQERADGAIQVDAVDYATMQRDTAFSFAVRPDGSPVP